MVDQPVVDAASEFVRFALPDSECVGAGRLEFLEPCFEVVGLEVIEDFGRAVPCFDFDVEVGEVAWFVVEMVAMLGVVDWVNPDDSLGGRAAAAVADDSRGDVELERRRITQSRSTWFLK